MYGNTSTPQTRRTPLPPGGRYRSFATLVALWAGAQDLVAPLLRLLARILSAQ